MVSTKELIQAMKSQYAGNITRVTLEKTKDAQTFWRELVSSVYYAIPSDESNTDRLVQATLLKFAESDTLELVNKQGKLLKRFAKFYKQETGTMLSDSLMGVIGDKLQYHVSQQGGVNEYFIDFTNRIEWNDGQFGKGDSCWWGCFSDSREVFTENGGWGIRFYRDSDDENGIGRCWILPRDGLLLCFNAYGVQRANVSKVLKAFFAQHGIILHYKKLEKLYNSFNGDIPYINTDENSGSSGAFVMYPEPLEASAILNQYDLYMEYNENKEKCSHCGHSIDTEYGEYNIIHDNYYCQNCADRLFSYCDACCEYEDSDNVYPTDDDRYLCRYCAEHRDYELCEGCNHYSQNTITTQDTDSTYCKECNHCQVCEECDEYYEDMPAHNERIHAAIDETGLIKSYETVHALIDTVGNYHTAYVYRVPDIEGLYLWQPRQANSDMNHSWSITHDVSGLVVKRDIESFAVGKRVLLSICNLLDWMQTNRELQDGGKLPQVSEAIREAMRG